MAVDRCAGAPCSRPWAVPFVLLLATSCGETRPGPALHTSVAALAEQATLISSGAPGEQFGSSVSVSGDLTVVGAATAQPNGAAYSFERGSNDEWWGELQLLPNPGEEMQGFGSAVAVSGNTALVGAVPTHRNGAAYVFVHWKGYWSWEQTLSSGEAWDGSEEGDRFGAGVAIDGDTAIVGAPLAGASKEGVAHVFVRSGGAWTSQQTLAAPDGAGGDLFGFAVAVDGDTAVVGAPDHTNMQGAAYVFVRSGDTWGAPKKLLHDDTVAVQFGTSVAVRGDTVVAGAPVRSAASGAVYVYQRSGEEWIAPPKPLTAQDAAANDYFGHSVALSGDTLVVGAYGKASSRGAAYSFVRSGGSWLAQSSLLASDGVGGDQFGVSVSVSDATAIVGADRRASYKGAAYVFALGAPSGDAGAGGSAGAGGGSAGASGSADASIEVSAPHDDAGTPTTAPGAKVCTDGSECASGFCVDGVCCDSSCTEPCHSCALPTSPGLCAVQPLGLDLRHDCGPAETCLGTCGGDGTCVVGRAGAQCAPNRCTGRSTGVGPGICVTTQASCPLENAVPFDCGAYACFAPVGACLNACRTVDDCADGYVCDENERCVSVPGVAAEDEGCGCRAAGRADRAGSAPWLVAFVFACGLLRRRRETR